MSAVAILPAIQCDHGVAMLDTCRECECPHNNVSEYFQKCDDCGADLSREMSQCPDCGELGPCVPSCHTQTDYEPEETK